MKRLTMLVCLALAMTAIQPIQAQGAPREENHCSTPFGGAQGGDLIDLNQLTGRDEAFVHPRYCRTIEAGESWILGRGCIAFWSVSAGTGIYPELYVPSAATPLEDLLSKLTIKLVVDPGTRVEQTFTYRYDTDPDAFIIWHWGDFGSGPSPYGDELDPIIGLIPINRPLAVGTHRVDLSIVMSADHWDGLGVDPTVNLLPAGESLVIGGNEFEVVSRKAK